MVLVPGCESRAKLLGGVALVEQGGARLDGQCPRANRPFGAPLAAVEQTQSMPSMDDAGISQPIPSKASQHSYAGNAARDLAFRSWWLSAADWKHAHLSQRSYLYLPGPEPCISLLTPQCAPASHPSYAHSPPEHIKSPILSFLFFQSSNLLSSVLPSRTPSLSTIIIIVQCFHPTPPRPLLRPLVRPSGTPHATKPTL